MKFWYEFWLNYYDDMSEMMVTAHGVMFAASTVELMETISGYYGDESIVELQFKIIEVTEDAPLILERHQGAYERTWMKEKLEAIE